MKYMTKELLTGLQEIYACLADDKSKQLFMDKLMCAISLDERFVYSLVKDSLPGFAESICNLDHNQEIIIYGAGNNCEIVVYTCNEYGLNISYICDRDLNKQGKTYFDIEVISPDELIRCHKDAVILVSTTSYYDEVLDFLREHFPTEQIVPFVNQNQIDLIRMQYFDDVVKLEDGEVFVDGGCFDFETSKILLSKCKADKIYAFEPDPDNLEKVKSEVEKMKLSNVDIIPAGMWDCNTTLHFNSQGSILSRVDENGEEEIKVVAVDEVVDGKVTFIKMDIEGSELKALHGAEQTIKKYKPKLAICIYHKLEDIIDIPAYIHSLVPEYKFYIRHYSFNAAETVLYAVL